MDIPNGKVIVKCEAQWCGPCKTIKPVLTELGQEYPDIQFLVADIEVEQRFASEYRVRNLPTFLTFSDTRLVGQLIGNTDKQTLKDLLEELCSSQ